MKYTLQQKLVAFGDDFSVFDESGAEAFFFDGKVFSIGKKIIVSAAGGQEIAVIRRKLFAIRPTFVVKQGGSELARIYKKLLTFRRSLVIDVPGPNDITIVGEVLEHNYQFNRNNSQIAEVSKKWFKGQDTYSVEVVNSNDALLVLCATVIVDLLCHPKRKSGFKDS